MSLSRTRFCRASQHQNAAFNAGSVAVANRTLEPLKLLCHCSAFSIKAQTLSKLQRLRCVPALILVRVKANGGDPRRKAKDLVLLHVTRLVDLFPARQRQLELVIVARGFVQCHPHRLQADDIKRLDARVEGR